MLGVGSSSPGIELSEYTSALARAGERILQGSSGTFWQMVEMRSLMRRPDFCLDVPSADEVRRVLWKARSPVATYIRFPDDQHPQNAWLYVCRDQGYGLANLGANVRRDIRRALRAFRIEFIDHSTLLKHGAECYCETRARAGLSDGTYGHFTQMYEGFGRNSAHQVLGAWAGDTLAAYMTLTVVDDWVDIYAYAANEHLNGCPNNGLIHFALDYFLVQQRFRLVNYGLSSIQEVSKAQGLHAFKKKVGFECVPVHRAFVFHPVLRPLANSLTLHGLRFCRRLRPGSPFLRRAAGMLATYLGHNPMPQDEANNKKT